MTTPVEAKPSRHLGVGGGESIPAVTRESLGKETVSTRQRHPGDSNFPDKSETNKVRMGKKKKNVPHIALPIQHVFLQ